MAIQKVSLGYVVSLLIMLTYGTVSSAVAQDNTSRSAASKAGQEDKQRKALVLESYGQVGLSPAPATQMPDLGGQ